jgi:hypothetical protein
MVGDWDHPVEPAILDLFGWYCASKPDIGEVHDLLLLYLVRDKYETGFGALDIHNW